MITSITKIHFNLLVLISNCFREPYYSSNIAKEAKFFRKIDDWKKELERTRCQNWRISVANVNYQLSPTLTTTLVVPQSVTDALLTQMVGYFRNACCPVWVSFKLRV